METVLAVLLALGIYVGVPIMIGLTVCSAFVMADRRTRKAERKEAVREAEDTIKEPKREHALVG